MLLHGEKGLHFTYGMHMLGTVIHKGCRAYFWVGSQGLNSFGVQIMNLLPSSCDFLTPKPPWEGLEAQPEDYSAFTFLECLA